MDAQAVTADVWNGLGNAPEALDRLTVTGPSHVLPSVFPVTAAATGVVGAATLAASELWRRRGGPTSQVAVNTRHAALACRSERLLRAVDRRLGDLWDDLGGVYAGGDGWIRLHTNLPAHRRAVLRVLGLDPGQATADRVRVGGAVARWATADLEDAVHDAGGCAGAMRSLPEWRATPAAAAVAAAPLVGLDPLEGGPATPGTPGAAGPTSSAGSAGVAAPDRPLAGMRVLDLSRVIAGPVAGRFLAAYGADVLRVDAPGGDDNPVAVADTTVGKRCTHLDLRQEPDRARFEELLAAADAVICAYRPGALQELGYGPDDLARLAPGTVVGTLSAYGGPRGDRTWGPRRGFDSLVQMVTGLADEGRRSVGTDVPVPLPAQLLDHVSGYLLAAGLLTALGRARDGAGAGDPGGPGGPGNPRGGPARHVQVSLAGTAMWLDGLGRAGVVDLADPVDELPDPLAVEHRGPLGRTRHVNCPGAIVGAAPHWPRGPQPLGHSPATWRT